MVKNLPVNSGDTGLIPGSGRRSGEENGNPLQYSCLGNPMDRGAWWIMVHGVEKSRTQLSKTGNVVVQSLSHVQLFTTPWTVARQVLLSVAISRQEYWGVLSFPSPGDLSDPGIETCISCIGRQVPYHGATWEALIIK